MSIQTKKELLLHVQKRYIESNNKDKRKIIDEFISITGYQRKYVIYLLNKSYKEPITVTRERKIRNRKYDDDILQALLTIWYASNQICSKRLAPFIPDLLASLEKFGHIALPIEVRNRLLTISAPTIDRLLKSKRVEINKSISTTRPGSLLKKQIKIRTFADWNDVVPGFMEGDLVAHCGNSTEGQYLNTLVLTDIASGWTEFFSLIKKSEAEVIAALQIAQKLLPFPLLGLDTDNGSEFINYGLLEFCKAQKITFTRSRAYKKNDQAHVEEKNGSIVRRLIGYDRYEGLAAYNALSEIYGTLRLYVNFFQPSLKLLSKKREGAKVSKQYDKAQTPYQRLLYSSNISEIIKTKLREKYNALDPIVLLKNLEKYQSNFWQYAWKPNLSNSILKEFQDLAIRPSSENVERTVVRENANYEVQASKILKGKEYIELTKIGDINSNNKEYSNLEYTAIPAKNSLQTTKKQDLDSGTIQKSKSESGLKPSTQGVVENAVEYKKTSDVNINNSIPPNIRCYRKTNKPRKPLGIRIWRTRPDAFKDVWGRIRVELEVNPGITATNIIERLIKEAPEQFKINQVRTLQKRIAKWRKEQIKISQEKSYQNIEPSNDSSNYVYLIAKT